MSRSLGLALLVAGLSVVPAAAATHELEDLLAGLQIVPLGDQLATPFTLESLDGKPVSLADLRGQATLLYFWESG